jgi:hypothetical protein
MKNQALKMITITSMLSTCLSGSIFGLGLIIGGYLLDWGPGGSTVGPFWKILLVGISSFFVGSVFGLLAVWLISAKLISQDVSIRENLFRSLIVVFFGCTFAFVLSWVMGFFMGKVTGAIEGLDWITIFVYTPLMSFIYSLPVNLFLTFLFGGFVFLYFKMKNKQLK